MMTHTKYTEAGDCVEKAATAKCVSNTVKEAEKKGCLAPPDVRKEPHIVHSPYGDRQDEYYWLRDDTRTNPEILAYLTAENAYTDVLLKPYKKVEDEIYNEVIARLKQDDASVPYRERGYWYYRRFVEGRSYPIYARRADKEGLDAVSIQKANAEGNFAGEQILLDVNKLAEGHQYYDAGIVDISDDGNKLIWAFDTNGRRQYTLKVTDLTTGEVLPDTVANTMECALWVDNGSAFIYVERAPETLLGNHVKKHKLGTEAGADESVYKEADNTYYMRIVRTRDRKFVTVELTNTDSTELRYAPSDNVNHFIPLAVREKGVRYYANHIKSAWIIRTNADKAKNFKIMTAPSNASDRSQWQDKIAHNAKVYIAGFTLFNDFMAVSERSDGMMRIRIVKDGGEEYLKSDESAYTMKLVSGSEAHTDWLRYSYESMTTPKITYEMNIKTGERRKLKQTPIPTYDAAQYLTERVWVPARDGVSIPVTLFYRKGFKRDGKAALLQYAYGSYGLSSDPFFSIGNISLADRGVVCAIAHVRGGTEMGFDWYENGRLLNKINTFNDFIDVTRWLVKNKYAAKNRVAAMGGSAGGLLMGAVSNMAPEDYRVILSAVPFVDVVTTMLDETIPLTTGEYGEWGNPGKSRQSYQYMLSYSPYDNLAEQAYPAMYIETGLYDSQVQYWEPAKYVARLRDVNTGKHPVVFRVNMEAGHSGKSGRFAAYRQTAEKFAFMLVQLGIEQ